MFNQQYKAIVRRVNEDAFRADGDLSVIDEVGGDDLVDHTAPPHLQHGNQSLKQLAQHGRGWCRSHRHRWWWPGRLHIGEQARCKALLNEPGFPDTRAGNDITRWLLIDKSIGLNNNEFQGTEQGRPTILSVSLQSPIKMTDCR